MKKSRKIIFRDFLSAAEFADLVLNEPACRGGELIHAADARKVTPVDGVCGTAATRMPCARRARTSSAVSSTPICPS